MTLRRKTILILTLTLVALILLLYLVLRTIMLGSFSVLEQQIVLRNVDRAENSFNDSTDSLSRAIHDWSSWDDTYQFVQDGNAGYIDANLKDDTLLTLDINLMMFVDTSNHIVYDKAVAVDSDWKPDFLALFENYARSNDRFFRLTTNVPTAGLVLIGDRTVLIASRPILHNDESGPKAGTLIWGRLVGVTELAEISKSLRLSVDLRDVNSPDLPADFRSALKVVSPASSQTVLPLDENTVAGYTLLNDIYGESTMVLQTSQPREVYWQGQSSLAYFITALVIVGVIFGVGVLLLLERLILSPLAQLSERVRTIGVNDDFSMFIPVNGNDELAHLASAINIMLNKVTQSHQALYESNTKLEIGVKERTTELERQRSQLQVLMETMGEGLVYTVDGQITYVNRAFVQLLGYASSDLVGRPFTLLNAQPDSTPAPSPLLQRYETRLARRDGSIVNVAVNSTPVPEADDHARHVIIVRDITQELVATKEKDYFFARASHDLRAPLTSIMTRLYLLGKRPDQIETHLRALNNVSNIMMELVNDLLDISRLEQSGMILNRRDVMLQSVVEEVVDIQEADAGLKQIRLTTELEETPLRVYGDPLRLNQVITNLVTNAIRYTPDGGEITIRVGLDERDGCQYGVVRVADNGIGISAKDLEHVFDAFFRVTNDHSGSGLGLYIVQEIVKLHGGEITVSSEVGKGTTFTVWLALSSGNGVEKEAKPDDQAVSG